MPRITVERIIGRVPCPAHGVDVGQECPGGGACDERASAYRSTAHAGRPPGRGRGLSAAFPLAVGAEILVAYHALPAMAKAQLLERLRKMIEKTVEKGP